MADNEKRLKNFTGISEELLHNVWTSFSVDPSGDCNDFDKNSKGTPGSSCMALWVLPAVALSGDQHTLEECFHCFKEIQEAAACSSDVYRVPRVNSGVHGGGSEEESGEGVNADAMRNKLILKHSATAEVMVRKIQDTIDVTQQFVNSRVACAFPVRDSWISLTATLALTALHLACWRLDYATVISLLAHGARTDILALEEVEKKKTEEEAADSVKNHARNGVDKESSHKVRIGERFFHEDQGLCAVHFLALGLRSPPNYSLVLGKQTGMILDITPTTESPIGDLDDSMAGLFLGSNPRISKNLQDPDSPTPTEPEALQLCLSSCLECLLQRGADPNVGANVTLEGAFPLDVFMQPPLNNYYGGVMARGNQSSICLRRQELEKNLDHVLVAYDILLRHGARLSHRFLRIHQWRPELLDTFHITPSEKSIALLKCLLLLKLFPDRPTATDQTLKHPESENTTKEQTTDTDTTQENQDILLKKLLYRFIVDVINFAIPETFISIIFRWSSFRVLSHVISVTSEISETTGWGDKLLEVLESANAARQRRLYHQCCLRVLKLVRNHIPSVMSLPLPNRVKKDILLFDY